MMLLNSGCLCCTLRSDLQETLRELFIKRRNGEIIGFERVIVETTGIADPAPVMQTLMTDSLLLDQFRLDCVVTLVDAVNSGSQLDTFPEAVKQVALADRLVLTKSDLAPASQVEQLEERLGGINARAPLRRALNGEVELSFLVDVGLSRTHSRLEEVERWLGAEDGHRVEEGVHRHHHHDQEITTFTLRFEQPLPWPAFTQCMEVLTALRGPDLLRVKGLVNVAGKNGPMVVQGVQHLFHPPIELAAWPSPDRVTRLVFITRGIPRQVVADLFAAIGAIGAGARAEAAT
jgi:G3E family GTPase